MNKILVVFLSLVLVGCSVDDLRRFVIKHFVDLRGYRYCELLIRFEDKTEVWGSQGLHECPQDQWEQIDIDKLYESSGADEITENGPRYFVMNSSVGMEFPKVEPQYIGDLKFKKMTTLQFAYAPIPYVNMEVPRENIWVFKEGNEVYLLSDSNGFGYVMQSMSLTVNKDLKESDLSTLGEKIDLPVGWSYKSVILDEDWFVPVENGVAILVHDNLNNTYQRITKWPN